MLGAGYAALAVAMFVEGWRRQREIYSAIAVDADVPTGIHAIAALTIAGGVLALGTSGAASSPRFSGRFRPQFYGILNERVFWI